MLQSVRDYPLLIYETHSIVKLFSEFLNDIVHTGRSLSNNARTFNYVDIN